MGILERLAGRRTYLDANVFLYALEGYPAIMPELRRLFAAIEQQQVAAATSELTLAELPVKPISLGNLEACRAYEEAITPSRSLRVVAVDRAVLVESARIRATAGMKLPDAIHLGSARLADCQVFLTNDRHIKPLDGVEVVRLSEFLPPSP